MEGSGYLWALVGVGVLLLGAALFYGGIQSARRRQQVGAPVGPRSANPDEAAYVASTERRSTGTYLLRLAIPVLIACAIAGAVYILYR